MAKYLIHASYSAEGLKGLYKDKASGRLAAVRQTCESVGGKLECMYYALGEDDVVIIADLPDNVAASALSLTASATGLVRTRTTALLTVEETDRALGTTIRFRGAGA
ncbi:MAG TPA: GYD domain-containing protein [Stellaceae bacterium]|nr:GYD domain-containing protein [Stellaceae bacterium]